MGIFVVLFKCIFYFLYLYFSFCYHGYYLLLRKAECYPDAGIFIHASRNVILEVVAQYARCTLHSKYEQDNLLCYNSLYKRLILKLDLCGSERIK